MPRSIPTGAPGIVPRRRRRPTRTSPRSWNVRPTGHRHAADLRRRPRSSSARPRSPPIRPPRAARAGRCPGQAPGRRLRRGAGLLAMADAGPLDDLRRARVDLLRAQIAFASSRGDEASPLLLAAARRLEPLDAALARETYLDAFSAAMFAGRLAGGRRSAGGRGGRSPRAPPSHRAQVRHAA